MQQPTLVFGEGNAGRLMAAGEGYRDGAVAFVAGGRTAPVAPAGASGECAFTALYLVLTRQAAARVVVTPVLDGVLLTASAHTLELLAPPAGEAVTERYELGLSEPYLVGGVERARFALRGCWFQLDVRVTPLGEGEVTVGGVEVEYESVIESLQARTS